MFKRYPIVALFLVIALSAYADGPKDNLPDNVRRIPPPGIAVPTEVRSELQAGLAELDKEVSLLPAALQGKPALLELLPDVQIYPNAVRMALEHNEFHNAKEFTDAKALLKQGLDRARALRDGKAPWAMATGLVVRGYVSKIDGSVQPYGLVVPASYQAGSPYRHRLDLWFHGRGETLSEVNFISQRQRVVGEFAPPHAFVLHPYGRYCNANKFAGEMDTFEALAHAKKHYSIDEDRIAVRGFSMGGAACWQFAVHYPGLWVAAAPGAGFSETPDFLKVFQNETLKPTWYEQKLWPLYDCTDYALNLANCPTVAYSGEDDKQKQAADMMAKAMRKEGMELAHIIGPKTAHKYHPEAKAEINRRIDSIVERGRERVPRRVRFCTYTLRYNESAWVRIDALGQHWEKATVDVEIVSPRTVKVRTQNVTGLTLTMPAGYCPLENVGPGPALIVDDAQIKASPPVPSDRSWQVRLRKTASGWELLGDEDATLCKRHGLQGPIDDAFMDSFLMVRPTGKSRHEAVGKWTASEMAHAVEHWRRQFRGEARIKNDGDVTAADIANHNLVLWGDPSSNQLLAKIADKLPIKWDAKGVQVGDKTYDANHVPVLIYPNPLNPKRYVVINSGFTYREYDYLNNARQVPKLPDWAVIDVRVPPSSRAPGGIAAAGFFGERWELMRDVK